MSVNLAIFHVRVHVCIIIEGPSVDSQRRQGRCLLGGVRGRPLSVAVRGCVGGGNVLLTVTPTSCLCASDAKPAPGLARRSVFACSVMAGASACFKCVLHSFGAVGNLRKLLAP